LNDTVKAVLIRVAALHQYVTQSWCMHQGHPSFVGKPLAVCHSNHAGGSAEISSCNYAARALGIKAGMRMCSAKSLCPQLLVLPYEVCSPCCGTTFLQNYKLSSKARRLTHGNHCSRYGHVSLSLELAGQSFVPSNESIIAQPLRTDFICSALGLQCTSSWLSN
jgi:hypothetical protein